MSCRVTGKKACEGSSTQWSSGRGIFPHGNFIEAISPPGGLHRVVGGLSGLTVNQACGEGMLELFQTPWSEITQKMPEIAEAGYDSLWLPNPAKGNSGSFSVGYDQFDPFDLGSTNQQGTIATMYGTAGPIDHHGADGAPVRHPRLFRQYHESPVQHGARLSRIGHADELLSGTACRRIFICKSSPGGIRTGRPSAIPTGAPLPSWSTSLCWVCPTWRRNRARPI